MSYLLMHAPVKRYYRVAQSFAMQYTGVAVGVRTLRLTKNLPCPPEV